MDTEELETTDSISIKVMASSHVSRSDVLIRGNGVRDADNQGMASCICTIRVSTGSVVTSPGLSTTDFGIGSEYTVGALMWSRYNGAILAIPCDYCKVPIHRRCTGTLGQLTYAHKVRINQAGYQWNPKTRELEPWSESKPETSDEE